jgi:hypothetical protein
MPWLNILAVGAIGVAAMRAAFERGDVDEAARQGALAGPAVVEQALGATDRTTRLAAVAAAPIVEDRAELLGALAHLADGADRRIAIPAASAARTIARELASRDPPDDIARDDIATWRRLWGQLAMRGDRWIELRMIALDTAAALDPGGIAIDLGAALRDPDAAFRSAAVSIVPIPAPAPLVAPLAGAVIHDGDAEVALGAAQSLCLSLDDAAPQPILGALGPEGLARIRALVASQRRPHAAEVADAARCLAADGSPQSAAALRALSGARHR